MIYSKQEFRPIPSYPTYPPYHVGDYLEDYFYRRFESENPDVSRNYIGISWTTLYCENRRYNLQKYLDSLPRDQKYFTVSQHDDAPIENLPSDTVCFSAGGNAKKNKVIPIPLICSPLNINAQAENRTILASFVGSNTHRIRQKLAQTFHQSKNIHILMKNWSPFVGTDDFISFCNLTQKSKFCICPRGYGLNSFRLYEAMQLGSIPVIVTDEPYLPWNDELNWNEFSVIIPENDIQKLEEILTSISEEKIEEMRSTIKKLYSEYFTMDGMYRNIIKRLNHDRKI